MSLSLSFPPMLSRLLLSAGLGAIALLTTLPAIAQTADPIDDASTQPALTPGETAPAIEPMAPVEPIAPDPMVGEPDPAIAPSSPDPTVSNDPYIDSTGYDIGATQRSSEQSGSQGRSLPAIGLPPTVQADSSVIGDIGLSPGRTTPSAQDFYNRTLRPPGRLGNGNIRIIFPLSIPAPITSMFGWRVHPVTGDPRFHAGTDIGAPLGTPVLAAYAGRVALADFFGGYGLAVALEHNKGTQTTLYGHLSEIFVKPGEQVKQGDVIGRVGSTGLSTGPHLHFEFRQLTPDGWVVMDAGDQLEYALAQLVQGLGAGTIQLRAGLDAPLELNLGAKGTVQFEPAKRQPGDGLLQEFSLMNQFFANLSRDIQGTEAQTAPSRVE